MHYAIVENGVVTNIVVADSPLDPTWVQDDGTARIGGTWDGQKFHDKVKTRDELYNEIVSATQARLDAFARTRSYDGILSATTYANSPTEKFQIEGKYCLQQRDATWASLLQMLAEVDAGTRPVPSGYADVEKDLPPLVWPN